MKCPTVNCNERISERSNKLYCKNCRRGMYYWSKKKTGEANDYLYQLEKRKDRIDNRKDRKAIRNGT